MQWKSQQYSDLFTQVMLWLPSQPPDIRKKVIRELNSIADTILRTVPPTMVTQSGLQYPKFVTLDYNVVLPSEASIELDSLVALLKLLNAQIPRLP